MTIRIAFAAGALALLSACAADDIKSQPTCCRPPPPEPRGLPPDVGDRVFFGYDRSDLTPEARATLDRQAEWLRLRPSRAIIIEGHADERGTRDYNLALGERRAQAVRNYLLAKGVAPTNLSLISYGKERLAVPGDGEAAWAQNRRSVTVVD
ncbi:MAG TPA: peptidoglycan-associated lipoprotein Pal [Azospirillum sp.]|nr:peptidoglycan-associated lipoprotein Pal [Azospirillum sp.]